MASSGESEWETVAEAQEYNELCVEIGNVPDPDYLRVLNRISLAECNKLLDLGCGTGNITFKLAEMLGSKGHVTGVDPDSKRINIAQENKQSNVTFVVGDGETFPEDQYDLVFCNYVMGSIENKKAVFERVSKCLCLNGQFIIVAILELPPIAHELSALMGRERQKVIDKMWFHLPATIYDELAEATGLKVTLREEDVACYYYPTIDSLFSSWFAVTHGRFDPKFAIKSALDEFKKKYRERVIEWKLPIARLILTKP